MSGEKLYLAAPLFTPQEREFNVLLAENLSSRFQVFLPQRDGVLIPGRKLSSSAYEQLAKVVFKADTTAIEECDVIFAVLNGRTIDEGVAYELGVARTLGKFCVGFWTDSRVLLPTGINPMISGALDLVVKSEKELIAWLKVTAKSAGPQELRLKRSGSR